MHLQKCLTFGVHIRWTVFVFVFLGGVMLKGGVIALFFGGGRNFTLLRGYATPFIFFACGRHSTHPPPPPCVVAKSVHARGGRQAPTPRFTPLLLLFDKKARKSRLFGCKRPHDGFVLLPPFCRFACCRTLFVGLRPTSH